MNDGGGSCITAAIAGPSRAKYMVMTGELVDAQQALDWGLIDFLVPDEEVDARALQIAAKIAAQPPVHVSVAKQLCDGVHGQSIRQGMNVRSHRRPARAPDSAPSGPRGRVPSRSMPRCRRRR